MQDFLRAQKSEKVLQYSVGKFLRLFLGVCFFRALKVLFSYRFHSPIPLMSLHGRPPSISQLITQRSFGVSGTRPQFWVGSPGGRGKEHKDLGAFSVICMIFFFFRKNLALLDF